MEQSEPTDVLQQIYYNPQSGYMGLNELTKRSGMSVNDVRAWYAQQAINQILVPRRSMIHYHKTIGDGDGYHADIIFFPHPRHNKGYIGLLTFINTSTRKVYYALIKNRSTEELMERIEPWIDHVNSTWGPIKSITTDNELYNNRALSQLFVNYGIEHFVETSGVHSKLGIINRFHRTLRNILTKIMIHRKSHVWIDIIDDAIKNYNNCVLFP